MKIDLTELDDYINTLNVKLYQIPYFVIKDVIDAISYEVGKDIKENAAKNSMLSGKYNYNELVNAMYIDHKVDKHGKQYAEINFKGMAPRTHKQGGKYRLAAIAFFNEYGVPTHDNQPSRPFMKAASVTGLHRAMPTVEGILEDWFTEAFAEKTLGDISI